MSDQFTSLIERAKEEEVLAFLRALTASERKVLAPVIKKLSKEYNDPIYTRTGNSTRITYKATDAQRNLLQLASFVCMNMADYEKSNFSIWMLGSDYLPKILGWYCPEWFSAFVNKQAGADFMPNYISYDWIMGLTEKGFLQPSKELIAKSMVNIIFENVGRNWYYKPEYLVKREITLKEHLWYLFDTETNLHYADRFIYFGADVSKDKIGWLVVLKEKTAEGVIPRERLLRESLLASNKNFNKVLSGWFCELFTELEPTKAELLLLQPELFGVLGAVHSKPVNTALNGIKKIVADKAFDEQGFLDVVPVLLSSTVKSVVASAMVILEKLVKKNAALALPVCTLLTQVFIHADDDLQQKAAGIINAYRGKLDHSFNEALAPYAGTMMAGARNLLQDFMEAVTAPVEEAVAVIEPEELVALPVIATIDDLVFLASQAFDNNQSWHIDLLPEALINLHSELKGAAIVRLEPALQRALKMTKYEMQSRQGYLDHMLAIFFIDVCVHLCLEYPADSIALEKLFAKFELKGGTEPFLQGWDNQSHDPFYLPYKQLLLAALDKIKKNDRLPLVSTPSHEPAWIAPEALVKRLQVYEAVRAWPEEMDLQVAVSRCRLLDTQAAVTLAKKELTGEYRGLVLFLFGEDAEPGKDMPHISAWLAASLARPEKKTYKAFEKYHYYKNPFTYYNGQFLWEAVNEEYMASRWDYNLKKDVSEKARRKIMRVHFPPFKSTLETGLQKFLTGIFSKPKAEPPLLYDYMNVHAMYFSVEHNDIKRVLLLMPNNPEPLLARIISTCLEHPEFWEETRKKMVLASLQALYEIWGSLGNMAHVFVGACMLSGEKTIAATAGEIWLKGIMHNTISNEQLGKDIGIIERVEFAPLKRFTNLLNQQLLRVSALHNKNVQMLIEYVLLELPDEPIKNLKKLLEIYGEVRAMNGGGVGVDGVEERLLVWGKKGKGA